MKSPDSRHCVAKKCAANTLTLLLSTATKMSWLPVSGSQRDWRL
jgi:hypothetical protein